MKLKRIKIFNISFFISFVLQILIDKYISVEGVLSTSTYTYDWDEIKNNVVIYIFWSIVYGGLVTYVWTKS